MVGGEQITTEIRLVRPLGAEAESQVWLAQHVRMGDVVIKFLGRPLPHNSSGFHRVRREAEVVRQIKNRHVADLLEHGVTERGEPYIVMPFLAGEDLGRRVERSGPLPAREVVRIIAQIGKGLSRAHQLGLVHRNIKPANVMLVKREDGETCAKVLDFGLTQHISISSMGHNTGGSLIFSAPMYASPEQLFGVKDVDFRADLWALALLAYFALTGKTPFSDMAVHEFAQIMHKGAFRPPSSYVPSLGPAVDAWFERALQRDPAARFASARELADELERALVGEREAPSSRASHRRHLASSPGLRGPSSSGRSEDLGDRIPISGAPRSTRHWNFPRDTLTEVITIQPPQQRKSSAVLLVVLALGGIAAIGTGLMLLSRQEASPPQNANPGATSPRTPH